MADTCEHCGCPEGVLGHDVLYRQIDSSTEALMAETKKLRKAVTRLGRFREAMVRMLDGCFCDDGRELPECSRCVLIRELLEEK